MLGVENPSLPALPLRPTTDRPHQTNGEGEGNGSNPRPAYAAYLAHLAAMKEVAESDSQWATTENAELAHIAAKEAAEARLAAAQEAKVGAEADREVLGKSDIDTAGLEKAIQGEIESLGHLRPRSALAKAKICRIRAQRTTLRDQQTALGAAYREIRHAALQELLAERIEVLIGAEAQYLAALVAAYGVAALVDESARAPGVRLDFAGPLDAQEVYLPRPHHPAFVDVPSPARADIAKAIA